MASRPLSWVNSVTLHSVSRVDERRVLAPLTQRVSRRTTVLPGCSLSTLTRSGVSEVSRYGFELCKLDLQTGVERDNVPVLLQSLRTSGCSGSST